MKSIRTRFSLWLLALLTGVLLIGNVLVFFQVQRSFRDELERNQRLIASGNQHGLEYFLSLVNQSGMAVVSDRLIGATLSEQVTDTFTMVNNRTLINSQFYHLTSTITGSDGYYYRSLLFLDERLPLASSFGTAMLNVESGTINCVYSNALVKDEAWYEATINKMRSMYVFLSDDKTSLCMARTILNQYYTGKNLNDGIGVMVTRVDTAKLEEVFSFSQVTPGTLFYLLSPENDILYSNDAGMIGESFIDIPESRDAILFSSGVSWNMRLLFVTPYDDILSAMRPVVLNFIITSLIVLAVAAALGLIFSNALTKPIIALSQTMKTISDTRLVRLETLKRGGHDEIAHLYESFQTLVMRVNALIADVEKRTLMQKQAEIKLMQAQINPHFLYNAMDSINWIALTNQQDEIADMVGSLAALLRYSISHADEPSTLGAELENIGHYASLQKVRYRDRVEVRVSVPPELYATRLPPITLQPLVENSMRHGMRDSFSSVNIQIDAHLDGDWAVITVFDDGVGCLSQTLNAYLDGEEGKLTVHNGLGIRNVNERLAIFCHVDKPLKYYNAPDGRLAAEIRVPAH